MNIKLLLVLGLLVFASGVAYGQTSNTGKVGVTFSSFSSNAVIYVEDVVGYGSYDDQSFFSFGINYIHPLKDWLELEAAMEYSAFTMKYNPPFYPGIENDSRTTKASILDIPVTLRAHFLKYFFTNGGVLLDIDLSDSYDSNSIENQSGIGGMFGVAGTYDFGFGASIFINPYVKIHSVIPFQQGGSSHQRIIESSIRFGITYRINQN